ncbi:MAG TPA: sugar ABC transporter permease [Acidothermaceae bacterium]|jgi:multiple sugar transport system permease protein
MASTISEPTARRVVRRRNALARREARLCYMFIAPGVLGFLLFILGPMLYSLVMSFENYPIIHPATWVGLKNWRALFHDPLIWKSLKVTTYFAVGSVTVTVVVGFLLALLLNQKILFKRAIRTIYFLPSVITGVPVALLWSWMFSPQFGLINTVLKWFGIQGPQWLFDEHWVIPALILMSAWSMGGAVIIYLAGLQGVPESLYEAAELDGAGAIRRTWYITIPMLSPIIFFNFVLSIIGSFQAFTQAYIMTSGGPNNSSLLYVLYLYRNAFSYFQLGYASAMGWLLFLVLLVLTLVVFRVSRKWVIDEATP